MILLHKAHDKTTAHLVPFGILVGRFVEYDWSLSLSLSLVSFEAILVGKKK
jgi:hypothetical protein